MRRQHGFSLVEVLIVVAVIALLATIAIPNLLRSRSTANEASAKSGLKAISTALENYVAIHSVYPNNTTALIGDSPPYLAVDYFSGTHNYYNFQVDLLTDSLYQISAIPVSGSMNTQSFTISTGAVASWYN